MAVGYADTGTATAVGYDATGLEAAVCATGTATAFGYAALGIPAAPAASTAPDALRLEITTADGTQLVNDLPRRNLSFTVEHNGSGSVSFDTDLSALPAGVEFDPDNPSNLARVHYGDLPSWPYGVAEGVPMSAPPVKNDDGSWSVSVQGPGSWDVLDFGLLWPPDGATGDTREFSYTAGMTSPSFVPAQWVAPVGKKVKDSFRWVKHRWPRGWPESASQWLWSTSPEKTSPNGIRFFLGDAFTLTARKSVRFYVAGDDNLRLYLNGALLKVKRADAWHTTASFTRTLPAGTYVLAAQVSNLAAENNTSGFVCAVAQLKADGSRDKWLLRSNPSTFLVRKSAGYIAQVPLPPDGWYPPDVLRQHVVEAAARGVDFHGAMTLTFTSGVDSNGSAWTAKGPVEYDIGISGAELGEKVRALGYDLAMLPGLRPSAWKQRGFDLRDRVTISTPLGVGWSSRAWPRVRTVGLTHQESGWTETAGDAGLSATYGRRELSISGGGVDGDLQADVFAKQAMTTAASPEETIEITYSSADVDIPQPFRDYGLADIVNSETIGGFQPVKVMSITGAEQDDKSVQWTIAGYPV